MKKLLLALLLCLVLPCLAFAEEKTENPWEYVVTTKKSIISVHTSAYTINDGILTFLVASNNRQTKDFAFLDIKVNLSTQEFYIKEMRFFDKSGKLLTKNTPPAKWQTLTKDSDIDLCVRQLLKKAKLSSPSSTSKKAKYSWEVILTTDKFEHSVQTSDFTIKDDTLNFWMSKSDPQTKDFTIFHTVVNLKTLTYRYESVTMFDKDVSVISRNATPTQWEPIIPNSAIDLCVNRLLNKQQTNKGDTP